MKPSEAVPAELDEERALREDVFAAVRRYHAHRHVPRPFIPGVTPVPVSGKVFDEHEMVSLADAMMDMWLTAGRFAIDFEHRFARRLGVKHALLCNSGSSANLLAVSALTSPQLGDMRLMPGDEVITVAASFPTTVNPIIQNRLVPVFVDVELETYNVRADLLEAALSEKTKAVVLAHTLGNPFDLEAVLELADRRRLWVVEDCCDALDSTYKGRLVGSFGDLSTCSFFPAHQITMGEGGAVATSNSRLKKLVESFRDWGRDCWCDLGKDNTCGKRFGWQLGQLPCGYDHKYTYAHAGYNLKATDMQAALGIAQLEKLSDFTRARQRNFRMLLSGLRQYSHSLILPRATAETDPAWFGFAVTVRDSAPFRREELTQFLESRKIATRLLFGGNITRQPYFKDLPHRISGRLDATDQVMRGTFWVGVFPGITEEMTAYMIEQFEAFFRMKGIQA